jgi:hypothetical protein
MPGGEHQQRRGDELNQPHHAEIEGAAGHFVDLPADRYGGDLLGKLRETAGADIEQKRPVGGQRRSGPNS